MTERVRNEGRLKPNAESIGQNCVSVPRPEAQKHVASPLSNKAVPTRRNLMNMLASAAALTAATVLPQKQAGARSFPAQNDTALLQLEREYRAAHHELDRLLTILGEL